MFSADIIFVADASKLVSWKEFARQKQVINYIARLFNVKENASRAALVTFGDQPVINVNFHSYKNLSEFQRLVDTSPLINGNRNIGQTMKMVTQLVKRARVEVPKIVIFLIKGGKLDEFSSTFRQYTKILGDYGAKLFVISVPSSGNYQILENVLEEQSDIMKFPDFERVLPKGPEIASYIVSRKNFHFL